MKIELANKCSDVNIWATHKGDLVIEFKDNIEVFKQLLVAVYDEIPVTEIVKTLDYEQMEAISEYFETIKDKINEN